jgi:hypothetical protein
MRRLGLIIACLVMPVAATGAVLPPPIADAAREKLQCYQPDMVRKTCRSMASYGSDASGKIINPATVLISARPAIVMATTTRVVVRAGRVCGVIRQEDVAAAEFTVDGLPATPEQTTMLREQVAVIQKPMIGPEICTAYVRDGAMLVAKATIGGVATKPAMDQKVIWVTPTEGYRVAP